MQALNFILQVLIPILYIFTARSNNWDMTTLREQQ